MDFKSFFKSKPLGIAIVAIGVLAVLFLVFLAGEAVEAGKANFSYRWGESYYRNLVGPHSATPFNMMRGGNFMMGYGTAGSIIKIDNATLTIQDERDKSEKTVVVGKDTVIRRFRDALQLSDLKVDDDVIVVGSPNNSGQIEARLIRVLPADGDASPQQPTAGQPQQSQ